MKRTLILFIAALFVFLSAVPAAMAAEWVLMDSVTTAETTLSASDWYASSRSRALLTVLLSIEAINDIGNPESGDFSSFWLNASWVGITKDKTQLVVVGYYGTGSKTTILTMIYTPGTKKIKYMADVQTPSLTSSKAESACEALLKSGASAEYTVNAYKKNSPRDIVTLIRQLGR